MREEHRTEPSEWASDTSTRRLLEALRSEPAPSPEQLHVTWRALRQRLSISDAPPSPSPIRLAPWKGWALASGLLAAAAASWHHLHETSHAPPPAVGREPSPSMTLEPPSTTAPSQAEAPPTAPPMAPAASSDTTSPPRDSHATAGPAPSRPSSARHRPLDEATLFRRAAGALRSGSARRTLRLLNRARRRFPQGALVQERALLRIEATIRLGDREGGEHLARRFLQRWPDSALAPRARRLLHEAERGTSRPAQ